MNTDAAPDAATDEYVDRVVVSAPPLTAEQRVRLAELFGPYRHYFQPSQAAAS